MEVLPIENKRLFLRYAIPCGEVLVRRGTLDPGTLEKLKNGILYNRDVKIDVASLFPVASRMCTIIARRMGKDVIDDEIIRRYFLFEHEKAIKWRAKIYPDISVRECMVYPARVLKTGEEIVINTVDGERVIKTLDPEVRRGDFVVTHYDYISERVPNETAKKLLRGLR